ncbi:MAG: nuclear transport factor 2 family protein [Candidatus Heimdallarchaeota archaeon]
MSQKKELAKVEEAVSNYMKGITERKFEYITKVWYDEAKMFGLTKGKKLLVTDHNIWKKDFKRQIKDPKYNKTSELLSIDLIGTIASAKVKTIIESSKGSVIYIDFLNLLKIEDSWQIVNKIFDASYE